VGLKGKNETAGARKRENGDGVLGKGGTSPSPPARGSGERCIYAQQTYTGPGVHHVGEVRVF